MQSGPKTQHFASDNYAGICPEAWNYMAQANSGHAPAYGDDDWTAMAADRIRELFAADCEVFFVFNGTAGNALALASMCQPYHAVICHRLAHIETDECGAPGFFSGGVQLITGSGEEGKLTPEMITDLIGRRDDLHFSKPHVVSLTQATEAGTLYSLPELRMLCESARQHRLKVHMDGARFANAVEALG
ncbi:MAG: threonine aldolase, partial [Desulfofustis sp.]|nr:threonine aldolase [Desulfofustis sp.]